LGAAISDGWQNIQMKDSRQPSKKATVAVAGIVCITILLSRGSGQTSQTNPPPAANPTFNASSAEAVVDLVASQLNPIKIEPVGTSKFQVEREAVGNIDYDEDVSVQAFSPYQGEIISAFGNLGAEVQQGQPFALTSKELSRDKNLCGSNGVSEREIEQAASDQQTADGALEAARDAVRLFGKTDGEIDRIVPTRRMLGGKREIADLLKKSMDGYRPDYWSCSNASPNLLAPRSTN
jgi:cobalt-zinc-cadmium efflux system membrane fusion protein